MYMSDACRGHKSVSDPLELELAMGAALCVLTMEPLSSAKAPKCS